MGATNCPTKPTNHSTDRAILKKKGFRGFPGKGMVRQYCRMRKIVVGSFITLDGVMQAAGGPEEGFPYGGWSAPYYDDALDKIAEKQKQPARDLLLGRKTFEMFASFFPEHEDIWPGVNGATKYVMSNTLEKSDWNNSVFLRSVDDIKTLK